MDRDPITGDVKDIGKEITYGHVGGTGRFSPEEGNDLRICTLSAEYRNPLVRKDD